MFTQDLKMTNTAKKACTLLADVLYNKGVRKVVVSPGSRNTPLIIAFSRHPGLEVYTVVDERSAAFVGLGMARAMSAPVAICCTSGTATLNYSPAVAEAYYSSTPLIVITADRPAELVERRAPQTIHQLGIYTGFIKECVDIPCEDGTNDFLSQASNQIEAIVDTAIREVPGPVHINVQLSAPLGLLSESKTFEISEPQYAYSDEACKLNKSDYTGRTFIFIGTGANISNELISEVAGMPGVVVFAECYTGAQFLSSQIVTNVDPTLVAAEDLPKPDRVIKVGNSLLSKKYYELYDSKALTVNDDNSLISLLPYGYEDSVEFKSLWISKSEHAYAMASNLLVQAEWSQFKAIGVILKHCNCCHVEVSNGMSIRYVQLFNTDMTAGIGCNRGVSGIDGSTSTAIGFAVASGCRSVLITGDMSFQYDIGALASSLIPDDFTIIVMNNRGGGIFRYIDTTKHLEELEQYISGPLNVPVEGLARAFGFRYIKVDSAECLYKALAEAGKKRLIIDVCTESTIDNNVLQDYYKSI